MKAKHTQRQARLIKAMTLVVQPNPSLGISSLTTKG